MLPNALGLKSHTPYGKNDEPSKQNCNVYVSNIYNGTGNTQTLISIIQQFEKAGIHPIMCFERTWQHPQGLESINLFPTYLRWVPGRYTRHLPRYLITRKFLRILKNYSPENSYVYLWPPSSLEIINIVKARGFCVFREMINCTARKHHEKVALARKNAELSVLPDGSAECIVDEEMQLEICDFITAPNKEVWKSLRESGIEDTKIIPTSFGWATDRFSRYEPESDDFDQAGDPVARPRTVLFVGSLEARKGIFYLLEAWKKISVEASLLLVGQLPEEMNDMVACAVARGNVKYIPFATDIERHYRAADIFIFPTVEEGGPQVTFEAAGCGLPVITTPMGAAGIIEDGRNGMIIAPHDVDQIVSALHCLLSEPTKRHQLARQAKVDAQAFTYDRVGASSASLFREKFAEFRGVRTTLM